MFYTEMNAVETFGANYLPFIKPNTMDKLSYDT